MGGCLGIRLPFDRLRTNVTERVLAVFDHFRDLRGVDAGEQWRVRLDAVCEQVAARLAKTPVGDPADERVRMGPLASHAQQADVADRIALLRQDAELVFAGKEDWIGEGTAQGAFSAPTLLACRKPARPTQSTPNAAQGSTR